MNTSHPQDGFTLIEIMVVLIIVALMGALLVFGFEQVLDRRKSAATEKVFKWLQSASDTAAFRSTVVGVTQKENQLMLLAFYQDSWYKLADHEPLDVNEEISIQWSESLIKNNELQAKEFESDDESYQSPYVIILPTGEVLPEGSINIIEGNAGDTKIDQILETDAFATINWDLQKHFELSWQPAQ